MMQIPSTMPSVMPQVKTRTVFLSKKPLTDEIKYSYCPICLEESEASGSTVALPKMVYVKNLIIYPLKNGGEHKAIDDYWLCPKCKRHLYVMDLLEHFTCRYDGSKWSEPPKEMNQSDGLSDAGNSV